MAEVETAVATTETEQAPAPATLAEHRAADPLRANDTPVPSAEAATQSRTKHRAKSQSAGAEDVKEIETLTRRLREAEDAIAIERNSGESDRAYQLRKRAEIAERAKTLVAAKVVEPAPIVRAAPTTVAQPQTASEFTEKEPVLADFVTSHPDDPYGAHQRALARYDRRKDEFDARSEAAKGTEKAQREVFDREMNEGGQQHATRIQTYLGANPDIKALFDVEAAKPAHEQIQLPIALRGAIEFHEKGPEFLAYLIQNPDFADELFLLTNGRPVGDPRTDPLVASVRRRLLQRVPDVKTGAPATPRQTIVAPRPPTPVRTAPQTPREKAPTEQAGSLAEHRRNTKTLGLSNTRH